MKIKFWEDIPGTDYKAGQVAEFNGAIELTYAEKYLANGLAEHVPTEPAEHPGTIGGLVSAEPPAPARGKSRSR